MSTTAKEIIFEEDVREKLKAGVERLAKVVAFTLGPLGRNVTLEKSWGAPEVTNDSRKIVSEVEVEDTFENMGVEMAKEVVEKIKETCGDGTTTGTVLLHSLVESGVKLISSGASPICVKRGMEKAVLAVTAELEKSAQPVSDDAAIRNIACVSSSGNQEIGNLIGDALQKVGQSGVVTIEEGQGTETTIEIVEGMQFDRGYLSPYFCTDRETMKIELASPQILIVEKKITSIHDLLPILQTSATTGKELLIIAEDIEGDALSTLVVNKMRGTLKVSAVKAPGFGDRRKAQLQDIAALTGATVITEDTGMQLKDVTSEELGSAEKVTITKDHTTLVKGAGSSEQIEARVKQIEAELNTCTSSYDKEKLEERKAKLCGGVAVIRVGAATQPELEEKKQRLNDSLNSTRAAQEAGVVTGGGVALLRASEVIDSLGLKEDEKLGGQLVKTACSMPLKQIAINSGKDGSVILEEVRQSEASMGYNVQSDKVENLVEAGVVDAAKVTLTALTLAASVAGVILITEAMIADAPEEKEEK